MASSARSSRVCRALLLHVLTPRIPRLNSTKPPSKQHVRHSNQRSIALHEKGNRERAQQGQKPQNRRILAPSLTIRNVLNLSLMMRMTE